VHPLQQKWV